MSIYLYAAGWKLDHAIKILSRHVDQIQMLGCHQAKKGHKILSEDDKVPSAVPPILWVQHRFDSTRDEN